MFFPRRTVPEQKRHYHGNLLALYYSAVLLLGRCWTIARFQLLLLLLLLLLLCIGLWLGKARCLIFYLFSFCCSECIVPHYHDLHLVIYVHTFMIQRVKYDVSVLSWIHAESCLSSDQVSPQVMKYRSPDLCKPSIFNLYGVWVQNIRSS